MKKVLLSVLFLLSACAELSDANDVEIKSVDEVAKVRNEKCLDIYKLKVFQVLKDNSALAIECEKNFLSESCGGKTVVIMPEDNVEFYDEMMIEAKTGKCFVQNGTYKYKTKTTEKTVPVITFDDEYVMRTEK